MDPTSDPTLAQLLRLLRPHPWHGVSRGEDAPRRVNAYVEIVPTDTIKYELDKATGLLKVDRPQQLSSLCPTLYGFIPQTWCGPATGALAARATGRPVERGDGDPLDLCVLTEKSVPRGDLLLTAIPVGGLRLIDRGEADEDTDLHLARRGVRGDDVGEHADVGDWLLRIDAHDDLADRRHE